ncbi:hypothetical protein HanRHA438_Chr14g0654211 [Helianthus annuus]|nr:hypothetical protein HanRHA438_Chr14g0654211 [Helianthus annuus]
MICECGLGPIPRHVIRHIDPGQKEIAICTRCSTKNQEVINLTRSVKECS